ncbi:hypothetical protein GCM10010885_02260 [Alicyclobacillus cellulosilyticus]|uniref:Bacterial type II secretion system protein E domain-containing protein n=1 Tax=Alicyclobacillus cellulosilyticus TaxID=1003997 RepID=A0A917K0N6_9BACL|nr:ATPase, T2SS/T4P/T4SS family [Alicyclobacillus cellulosilyticus]GGI96141.1 hypothetical protein GCM10010885_02260 [Alicyclobacillus cellulosilyticus]
MEELSAVDVLQRILDDGIRRRASDIHLHLYAQRSELDVRFRVGGRVMPYLRVNDLGASLIRRVKALARMDVAETRVPQDGAFVWQRGEEVYHVRTAVMPTVYGEAAVLRLLVASGAMALAEIGLRKEQVAQVERLLQRTSGMILVSGTTGAGKTTTLYALMSQLARSGRHVVSIEDPVEVVLDVCDQVEVRERQGVTFAAVLKALLRHDPDAIMIGEIRDEETARVAVRAALTGHLVLSTTHARDFVGAAARLAELGVPRPLIADVLLAVITQSLTAAPCRACGGIGCARCAESGMDPERAAAFAILEVTPEWAARLASDASWAALRAGAEGV